MSMPPQLAEAEFRVSLQSLMSCIKTETQQDVALMCFKALRGVLEGCFTGNLVEANLAKSTLEQAVGLAFKVHLVGEQVEQIPEEQRSTNAQRFVTPVGQDSSIVEELLGKLDKVNSKESLQAWYSATEGRRNQVGDQEQRNKLYDAIRAKKGSLC